MIYPMLLATLVSLVEMVVLVYLEVSGNVQNARFAKRISIHQNNRNSRNLLKFIKTRDQDASQNVPFLYALLKRCLRQYGHFEGRKLLKIGSPPKNFSNGWMAGLAGLAGLAGWLGWLAGWLGWLAGLAAHPY